VEELRDKRVLVTGGAGFVGSNLSRMLLAAGVARLHIVDNLLSADRSNIPADSRVEFTEASIANDLVLHQLSDEYEYVFHLATYHGNQSSIHDPIADHEHNQLTTLKLFDRIKGFGQVRKVVYSGAGCAVAEKTYGHAVATSEDAPISLAMDSPYSISKIVGEFYAVYYHAQHKLPTVRARFQNVYGPGEILGAGQWRGTPATVWRNVVPTFIYKALAGERLPVEGGGEASRDFVFVEDICRGLVRCAVAGQPGDVYNLASGVETSILDLATAINAVVGNVAPLEFLPRRSWDHSGRRFGSGKKSKAALGFECAVDLKEGLNRTVAWTRENLPLIEQCIQRHARRMATATAAV
jgi:UDP-glucose 4-epimerase